MKEVVAGRFARAALACKHDFVEFVPLWLQWLVACGGPVGRALALAGRPLKARERGVAVTSVFPVPFVSAAAVRGAGVRCQGFRLGTAFGSAVLSLINI